MSQRTRHPATVGHGYLGVECGYSPSKRRWLHYRCLHPTERQRASRRQNCSPGRRPPTRGRKGKRKATKGSQKLGRLGKPRDESNGIPYLTTDKPRHWEMLPWLASLGC